VNVRAVAAPVRGRAAGSRPGSRLCDNRPTVRFLRLKPGHGEILLAEGDLDVREEVDRLVDEFRRQLDAGMWAAVPSESVGGRREATMVKAFDEIPRDADRVIFFPRAAGGA
jgi:hypothetical protein